MDLDQLYRDARTALHDAWPGISARVEAEDRLKLLIIDQRLRNTADDILRQVVCDCGNYRHHGIGWMPEGSGEGLTVAINLLRSLIEDTVRDSAPLPMQFSGEGQ